MPHDPAYGGPSLARRQVLYDQLGLAPHARVQVESSIRLSGRRQVGKGALTNVRVHHQSRKNAATRTVESHMCEFIFALELELDRDVLGYYCQVPCPDVTRTVNGRLTRSLATLDFLVLREDQIDLVECKFESKLTKLAAEPNSPWCNVDGRWTHESYSAWASRYGMRYLTWVAPDFGGIYRSNLEACYAVAGSTPGPAEVRAINQARAALSTRVHNLQELCGAIPEFNARLALWMLAHGMAFGPLRSRRVIDGTQFNLCGSPEQARHLDDRQLSALRNHFASPVINDALLTARKVDIEHARARLERLQRMTRGEEPWTARFKALHQRVERASRRGLEPLAACLTRYHASGNRGDRLSETHLKVIKQVLARWQAGEERLPRDLTHAYEAACKEHAISPAGVARLHSERRRLSPQGRALSVGGFRGFQAISGGSDPTCRSLPPLGYGHTLYIDSSKFDVRLAPALTRGLADQSLTFYVAVDVATGMPMGHSLVFGPARTTALATLLRECVHRSGCLPRTIQTDRGTELTSKFFAEFCRGSITYQQTPTAGSRFNQLAESFIDRVNSRVAHQLPGSTLPDQKGRSVDGKFRSYRTARLSFAQALEALTSYVYDAYPDWAGTNGETPREARDRALDELGLMGTPATLDDAMLIRTSIALMTIPHCDPQRGFRRYGTYYSHPQLLQLCRNYTMQEVRADCCRPERIYVRIADRWLLTTCSGAAIAAALSDAEALYERLSRKDRQAERRRSAHLSSRKLYDENCRAVASRQASDHLIAQLTTKEADPYDDTSGSSPIDDADDTAHESKSADTTVAEITWREDI